MSEKGGYLSKYSIGRGNYEQLIYGDQSVTFYNEEMNICRELIDGDGNILNFPGVLYEEQLIREYGKREIQPVVKYSASFERCAYIPILMKKVFTRNHLNYIVSEVNFV